MTTTEQRAKLLADAIERGYARWEEAGRCDPSCGCVTVYIEREITPIWTAALAACAREAKLEQAEESEQALLAARKFVRGRHSVLTYGPRVLLEQLDLALLRITKLRLEVSGERAVGESK